MKKLDQEELCSLICMLVEIFQQLRSPDGCPWDREQTHSSLRAYTIEEAYELSRAIDTANYRKIGEELGDLLLHILFHCQIAAENDHFDLADVMRTLRAKLIRRHPHVFGKENITSAQEVLKRWHQIKSTEAKQAFYKDIGLPSLLRAYKMQKRAACLGFDWRSREGPIKKIYEELKELEKEGTANHQNIQSLEDELGDLLFAAVNFARHLQIDPEIALARSCDKFERRFNSVIEELEKQGKTPEESSLEEMDAIWDRIKSQEKPKEEQ